MTYSQEESTTANTLIFIGRGSGKLLIPLLTPAIQILEKYKAYPICLKNQKALPVQSNQKMNSYLKEISAFSGIEKRISTHTARHTFATTVTLANSISMESGSKILGHSDMTITKQYARILDLTLINEMSNLAKKQY